MYDTTPSTTDTTPSAEQIVTLLDAYGPAKTRYDRMRRPDMIDPVTGEHVWMHDDAVVIVQEAKVPAFRAYMAARGLAPIGRESFTIELLDPAKMFPLLEQVTAA